MTRREATKLMLAGGTAAWAAPLRLWAQGFPGDWSAKWIWMTGESKPFHYFLMARGSFTLPASPRSAKLSITAQDRYMLYVNGEYLGRGPARGDTLWMSYDTYDVQSRLRPGKNTVAVLAYYYGCTNNYTRDARAGLFAQLDLTHADGTKQAFGTDKSWKLHPAQGWKRDVGLINTAVGVTEIYDANRDPLDWMNTEFDDTLWQPPRVLRETSVPWGYLEARQTPMMQESEVFPVKVVGQGEVREIGSALAEKQVPERLNIEPHFPLQYAKIEGPQESLGGASHPWVMQSSPFREGESDAKGSRSPFIIVDFGRAVFGFPRIRLNSQANSIVDLTYGPVVVDGRVPPLASGVRYGDRLMTRAGDQTWQVHEYKQFRYLQIVVRKADAPVTIKSLSLISYDYPAERKGSFECSDPMLNKLWKACVDTTYLHMEDHLICDAVRERRGWTGDGSHGLYGIYAGYGDIALTDRYFRLISRGAVADGMLRMYYPGSEVGSGEPNIETPSVVSENPVTIPQFALLYTILLGEASQYFGKTDLVKEIYPTLVRVAGWYKRHEDAAGLASNLPGWNWFDWVETDMEGANFETNALYCRMLEVLSVLARVAGYEQDAGRWLGRSQEIKEALRKFYWDGQKGLFVDSYSNGKPSKKVTELSNGMALLWDIATPEQAPVIVSRLLDPHTEMARVSPLYFYYVIEGLIKAGAAKEALKDMRTRYTPMLEAYDPPTIWESWKGVNAAFGASSAPDAALVHTGGAGPAWTLSKHVLGVQPVGAGFEKCRIEPCMDGLEWAKGVFPSVKGNISVEWKKTDEHVILETTLPEGLETVIRLPRIASKNFTVIHNGGKHALKSPEIRVTGGHHHLEILPG